VVNTYSTTLDADTKKIIRDRMNNMDSKLPNFTIQIFHADASGNRMYSYDASGSANYGYQSDSSGTYVVDNTNTKIYTKSDSNGTYLQDKSGGKVYVNLNTDTGIITGVNASQFSSLMSSLKIQGVDPATNAKFGEYVGVEITCDYNPIVPSLLMMNQTLKIHSKALMSSEAN
jgi:hypothetical protein